MKHSDENETLKVVGIGASAGGLEALQSFLKALPSDTNFAYIIAQHLDPKQPTMLGDLLSKSTPMPVIEAKHNEQIQKNTIYYCPPNNNITISKNTIILTTPSVGIFPKPSVDTFFLSLAKQKEENAVGVILSGTGSDGSLGMKAIKIAGGVTIAQEEGSAKYSSMPRAAIDTGHVDAILPPAEIAKELSAIIASPNVFFASEQTPKSLDMIYDILLDQIGTDFTDYKINTIQRRIRRRMAVNKIEDLENYVNYLQSSQKEISLLHKDLLVVVTSFFRDKEAFESLDAIIETIVQKKQKGDTLRLWVPGCATGEEVFSITMLAHNKLVVHNKISQVKLQVFATDISDDAIEVARSSRYFQEEISKVPNDFIHEYFVKKGSYYAISSRIRDCIVISKHDLIKDPPFIHMDLISCRNLLIYFNNTLQKRLFAVFHHALSHRGYLFLGRSESTNGLSTLFNTVDATHKIFQKQENLDPPKYEYMQYYPKRYPSSIVNASQINHTKQLPVNERAQSITESVTAAVEKSLARDFVIIDKNNAIIYSQGDVKQYFDIPMGRMNTDIFSFAKDEIRMDLRTSIYKTRRENKTSIQRIFLPQRYSYYFASLPLENSDYFNNAILILFFHLDIKENDIETTPCSHEQDKDKIELEHELLMTKEKLQTTIEELETANEELQSTNEELQSSNEELRSTNEELETSNEELQSSNEELSTVNEELESKSYELRNTNEDLENIFKTMGYGVVIVNKHLKVRKFTPMAKKIFNISEDDLGAVITTVESYLDLKNLKKRLEKIIHNKTSEEYEMTHKKSHYFVKFEPFTNDKGEVDGAILVFYDKTQVHKTENELLEYKNHLEELVSEKVKQIQQINENLEKEVTVKIEEIRKKEQILIQQSKLASMGEMLGNIAHQWRQPLNALMIQKDLMIDSFESGELNNELAQKFDLDMSELIFYMSKTIDDFRNFCAPSREKVVFNLSHAVNEALDIVQTHLKSESIEIKKSFGCEDVQTKGYPNEFKQVLINIINNAKDAILENRALQWYQGVMHIGFICLDEVDGHKNCVQITIEDNGGGINEKFMQKIFEPYFTTKFQAQGTGLGLYMSKTILEKNMNGTLTAHNGKHGAKFIIELYEVML